MCMSHYSYKSYQCSSVSSLFNFSNIKTSLGFCEGVNSFYLSFWNDWSGYYFLKWELWPLDGSLHDFTLRIIIVPDVQASSASSKSSSSLVSVAAKCNARCAMKGRTYPFLSGSLSFFFLHHRRSDSFSTKMLMMHIWRIMISGTIPFF